MSTLALAPIFVFFLLFQRLIIEGVAMSGLKG
jgi:ABC-type glycerol-3-phosphate transport system permease component